MARKKTHEEYTEEVKSLNPNIEVVGEYINARTKILHKCLIHNVEWEAYPDNILRGCGCCECGIDKTREATKKKHEEYIHELLSKDSNIISIEEYNGANNKILHKCIICDYEWKSTPANILTYKSCPKCAGNIRLTNIEFKNRLEKVNKNIIAIEEYNGMNNKIKFKCLIDEHEWITTPNSVLSGCGCPKCGRSKVGDELRKTDDQYKLELNSKNKYINVLDEYKGANVSILHECLICGTKWHVTPAHILSGTGCPKCNASYGEKEIEEWLKENKIKYFCQHRFNDCRNKRTLPFDFYLPEYNMCIEYDGEQHYKAIGFFGGQKGFEYRTQNDKIKNDYCKLNNIKLLRIPYYSNIRKELNKQFLFI